VPIALSVAVTAGSGAGNSTPRQVEALTIDYGDGITETRTNVTGSVGLTHTYQQARGYTITATARDVNNNTGVASKAIVISRVIPSAGISASPQFGSAPLSVTYTITAGPGTGGPPIESVRAFVNGVLAYSGTGAGSFSQRYTTPGNYTVEVVVRDTAGNEARASTVVAVN